MIKIITILTMLTVLPINAMAVIACKAKVDWLDVTKSGTIQIMTKLDSANFKFHHICNLENLYKNEVGVSTCMAWYDLISDASINLKEVTFAFENIQSCSDVIFMVILKFQHIYD